MSVLVLDCLSLDVDGALLKILDEPLPLRRCAFVLPAVLLCLLLELSDLLLATLDLGVEFIQICGVRRSAGMVPCMATALRAAAAVGGSGGRQQQRRAHN